MEKGRIKKSKGVDTMAYTAMQIAAEVVRQYHEKGNPPFYNGIVEMGHAGIKGWKPAGRNSRQGVVQGIDKIHAAQEENNQGDEGKAGIHAE